ncbi:MAG: hypothetical protein M3458_06215 [Acidobacteriota bacterium]|nr:hypothetical protein [Acidobacteriota bacterium]
MFDEQAFIAQVESASADQLARILSYPTLDQEKALRAHLGDGRYQRMHSLALKRSVRRAAEMPQGNVVVIHGIMGSELTVSKLNSEIGDLTWVNAVRIMPVLAQPSPPERGRAKRVP